MCGPNEWFVGEFLNHAAGPDAVYQALTGQNSWTDPEFVEAVDPLNTMQERLVHGRAGPVLYATADERLDLGDGAAAMNIEGTWALE